MKPIRALPLVLLALPFLTPPVEAASPSPTPVVQNKTDEFMTQFRQAMKVGATSKMNELIRKYEEQAIFKIVEIAEFISAGSSEDLEEEIAALTKAWKAVHKTSFPDKIYEYFSLMRPEIKQHRISLKTQYQLQNRKFVEAEQAKDETKFGEIGMQLKGIGESFEKIGDHYYASQAYLLWGKAFDEYLRKENADLKMAHDAFKLCVAAREKVDLKDVFYAQTRERQQHLEKSGYGDPEKKVEVELDPTLEPMVLATTFEVVPAIDTYQRPLYMGDAIYAMWHSVGMREKGTNGTVGNVGDSLKMMRTGSSKVMTGHRRRRRGGP